MIKQFEYVFRYLLNGRGSSLVKIISLTLGLVVSLVLYTQIAFEFSYDSFYPDSERIYRIRHINQNGEKPSFEDVLVHTPMPGCIKSDIRGVEDACLSAPDVELKTFLSGDKQFVEKVLNVDSSFMDVFRLPVLSGDIRKMALPYQVFLSGSAAQRMFGMNGDGISNPETKEQMFSYKLMGADKDFFNTFRIALQSGKCFEKDGDSEEDVIVNEAFAHMLETHQFPLDGYFLNIDGKRRITGIVQDFRLTSLYDETMPLMITSVDPLKGYWLFGDYFLTVRLDNYSPGELDEMNKKLLALTRNEVLAFTAYKDTWRNAYDDARLFRNSVIASSVIMLLITLLGLIAYVEDEIFRRHKEIAIRKINGATIKNVLAVVSKDFSFVVIPAMIVGSLLSYVLAQEWLRQFSVQVSLPLLLFILTCVSLLGFLLGCIYLRSWSAANENPVNSIKVE